MELPINQVYHLTNETDEMPPAISHAFGNMVRLYRQQVGRKSESDLPTSWHQWVQLIEEDLRQTPIAKLSCCPLKVRLWQIILLKNGFGKLDTVARSVSIYSNNNPDNQEI